MNKKSRMMIMALLLTGFAYHTAAAGELCQGEPKHAVPTANATHGSMVSISLEQGQRLHPDSHTLNAKPLGAKQLASKQLKTAERYQKPILIDKGVCHYKLISFKQASIKM